MYLLPGHVLGIRTLQVREGRVWSNQDPFDRILIAQARAESYLLLTHDSHFENYREK